MILILIRQVIYVRIIGRRRYKWLILLDVSVYIT